MRTMVIPVQGSLATIYGSMQQLLVVFLLFCNPAPQPWGTATVNAATGDPAENGRTERTITVTGSADVWLHG